MAFKRVFSVNPPSSPTAIQTCKLFRNSFMPLSSVFNRFLVLMNLNENHHKMFMEQASEYSPKIIKNTKIILEKYRWDISASMMGQ